MEEKEQPSADAAKTKAASTEPGKNGSGRKRRAGVVIIVLLAVGVFGGLAWWARSKTHISTDDAFIDARIHSISSKVGGTVARVLVNDNQPVKKGDLLVELDPKDYLVQVQNAQAELDMALNETSGDYAQLDAAKATAELARARLDQADLDLHRGRALYAKEVIPREQLDRLETQRRMNESQLRESRERVRKEQSTLGLSGQGRKDARVAQKRAKLEEARLNLSYTRIYAPADGYVTRKSVEPGNNLQPGQPLMAVVALHDSWITANYKESQLTHVLPGQTVTFEVDAYPGQDFSGKVDSIMAGTGAAFSLLPPENASGNYVKVVQRIPVKIALDPSTDPQHRLRVGMSVVPTIRTGQRLGDVLRELNPF